MPVLIDISMTILTIAVVCFIIFMARSIRKIEASRSTPLTLTLLASKHIGPDTLILHVIDQDNTQATYFGSSVLWYNLHTKESCTCEEDLQLYTLWKQVLLKEAENPHAP